MMKTFSTHAHEHHTHARTRTSKTSFTRTHAYIKKKRNILDVLNKIRSLHQNIRDFGILALDARTSARIHVLPAQ